MVPAVIRMHIHDHYNVGYSTICMHSKETECYILLLDQIEFSSEIDENVFIEMKTPTPE